MVAKKTKEVTYTQDQVRNLVAEVFTELVVKLQDPSLVIAGKLAMALLDKEFNK